MNSVTPVGENLEAGDIDTSELASEIRADCFRNQFYEVYRLVLRMQCHGSFAEVELMFNSLKYAKQLIEAGFSREQAEAQMMIMADLLDSKLAMKDDVNRLSGEVRHEFAQLDSRLESKFSEFNTKLVELEVRMLRNNSAIMAGLLAAAVALNKLIS